MPYSGSELGRTVNAVVESCYVFLLGTSKPSQTCSPSVIAGLWGHSSTTLVPTNWPRRQEKIAQRLTADAEC